MTTKAASRKHAVMQEVPVDKCVPDPENRKATASQELIDSVATHGVLEPILVTTHELLAPGDRFAIVAGERRWRAAKAANLKTVPAVVREGMTDRERIEAQITENLHRQDLDPVEEARQLQRLITIGCKVPEVAKTVSRKPAYVKDRLLLLHLPEDAQAKYVDDGDWTLQDAVTVAKLYEEDTDEARAVIQDLMDHPYYSPRDRVPQLREHAKREAAIAAECERLESAGHTLVDGDDYGVDPVAMLREVHGKDKVPTLAKHRKLACHGYQVGWDHSNGCALAREVCTDLKAHGITSRFGIAGGQTETQKTHNRRAKQRREWVRAQLPGWKKAEQDELLQRAALSHVADYKLVASFVDMKVKDRADFDDQVAKLTGAPLRRLAVACAACSLEKDVWQYGTSEAGAWWERWVKGKGLRYKRAPKAKK